MNSHKYFCNLYQAYLMATNSFKYSHATLEIFRGNTMYDTPGKEELTLIFNEMPEMIAIRIYTNYVKRHHSTYQDKYYNVSEIEALSYQEGFNSPFYSLERERIDKKTFRDILIITRRVLL